MPFVPVQTLTYAGSATRAVFQSYLDALNGLTPTRVLIPFGLFTLDLSLRYQGKGNLWLDALTPATPPRFICTAALNGSNQDYTNNLFNFINGVSVGSQTVFQKNIGVTHLYFDATLQNKTGLGTNPGLGTPAGTGDSAANGEGINLCIVELQNVHNAFSLDNTYIGAYGNAFVSASIDPAQASELEPAWVEHDRYDNCVRGELGSIYGQSGAVIQLGAMRGANVYPRKMKGGTVRRNYFLSSGGPIMDAFNTRGMTFEHNQVDNSLSGTISAQQAGTLASFHSDFGLVDSFIRYNKFSGGAGGIFLNGLMLPVFVTDYTPTQGPTRNRIEGNEIYDTPLHNLANFIGEAKNTVHGNATGFNQVVQWVGGATVVPQIRLTSGPGAWSNPVQTGSSAWEGRQFLVPTGFDFQFDVTATSAFSVNYAPNSGVGHIQMNAGNGTITGTLGAGTGATSLNLSGIAAILDGAAGYDDIYNGMLFTITSGAASGAQGLILDYNGTTGVATVATLSPAPANGDGVRVQTLAPGFVERNEIWNNKSYRAPNDAFVCYDGRYNDWWRNEIYSPGDCLVGSAFSARDTQVISGCGYRDNTHRNQWIEDTRTIKKLVSNYDDDTANSTDNVWADTRNEVGSGGTYTLLTARTRFHTARNYGPGVTTDSKDYAKFLPGEKAGAITAGGQHPGAGSLGRGRIPL